MHDHPHPLGHGDVGSVLTRREALGLFTTPFLLAFAGCEETTAGEDEPLSGSCVVRPELTEGPFYVDAELLRSDIREDRAGVPLALAFSVSRVVGSACELLPGAIVDVWHADASGAYSGVGSQSGTRFLRGSQQTGADGAARFTTIYPGWYAGRTPHIHFKVRSSAPSASAYEFTSQLFFDDALSREIYTSAAPYTTRGVQDRSNASDGIYRRGGARMLLDVSETDGAYTAAFDIALLID